MGMRIQAWAGQIGTENPPAFRMNQDSAFFLQHSRQITFFLENLLFLAYRLTSGNTSRHLRVNTATHSLRQRKLSAEITGYTFAS